MIRYINNSLIYRLGKLLLPWQIYVNIKFRNSNYWNRKTLYFELYIVEMNV